MTQERKKKLNEAGLIIGIFAVAFGIVVGVSFAFRELLSYFENGKSVFASLV